MVILGINNLANKVTNPFESFLCAKELSLLSGVNLLPLQQTPRVEYC